MGCTASSTPVSAEILSALPTERIEIAPARRRDPAVVPLKPTKNPTPGDVELWSAIDTGDTVAALLLLQSGTADATFVGARGRSLLHRACFRRLVKVSSRLLECGAPVNVVDDDKVTPLHVAAGAPELTSVVERLIAAGAALDARCRLGATALQYACESGQESSALALIAAGANVRTKDKFGVTPLGCCSAGSPIANALRAAGAKS